MSNENQSPEAADDHQSPPPPPEPKPAIPPQQGMNGSEERAQEEMARRGVLPPVGGRRRGPRPIDYLSPPDESSVLRIKRDRAFGDVEETGYCGNVANAIGFEDEVRSKFGGGEYTAVALYGGKPIEAGFRIAGDSLPIRRTDDDDDENEYGESGYPYNQSGVQYDSDTDHWRGRVHREPHVFDRQSVFQGGFGQNGGFGQRAICPPQNGPYGGGVPFDGAGVGFGSGGPGFNPGFGGPVSPGFPGGQFPGAQQPFVGLDQHGQLGVLGQVPGGAQPYGYNQGPVHPWNAWQQQTQLGLAATPRVYIQQPQEDEKENSKIEELQAQIELAREETRAASDLAAQEREERRLEQERADAARREAELKNKIDQIQADSARRDDDFKRQFEDIAQENRRRDDAFRQQITASQNQGPNQADKMIEMQMIQAQNAQTRMEQERLDRDTRVREESALRRAEIDKRDADYRRDQERREKIETEERRREESRRSEDKNRDEGRRKDQERHYQQMLEMSVKNQQTPDQMLAMLKNMVDLTPKQENATTQVMELAQAAMAMRDIFGQAGNEQAESQWVGIIKTGGEALGKAISDIQANRAQQAQQAQQIRAQQQRQYPGLPAPQVQQPQVQQPPQPLQQQPQVGQDASSEEWARILGFVVDAHDSGNDPETTAGHLHTMVTLGMQRQGAIDKLAAASADQVKFQLVYLNAQPEIATSPLKPKIDRLVKIIDDETGRVWVEELLGCLATIREGIREAAEQQRQHTQTQVQEEISPEEFSRRARAVEEVAEAAEAAAGQQQ